MQVSQRGRSARTRPQRLARRRAAAQGVDRGSNRRSWLRSRWVLGTFGIVAATALIVGLVATAFDNSGPAPTADPPPVRRTGSDVITGSVQGKPLWDAPPALSLAAGVDYGAEILLDDGEVVVIDLLEDSASTHVNNFVFLARQGFYDELTFHEVLPGVRVRAGDPTAGDPNATWSADAGYVLEDESGDALGVMSDGMVAMWRDESGISSSQFLITLSPPEPGESDALTAFGRVISGIEPLYGFGSRDPSAIPPPPAGPKIVTILITEDAVGATTEVQTEVQADQQVQAQPAEETAAEPETEPQAGDQERPTSWDSPPEFALEDDVDYHATITMADGGVIEIDLFEELAPQHVNSFVFLARQGFYDTLTFHRIIHGFMAQGGDPTGTGAGGPGYTVDAEFNETPHVRGILSMARSADPNSGGSQFFIMYDDAPHLDGQYTAFGEVTSGMEVVDAFPARDPSDPNAPLGPQIATITIREIARAE